MCCPSPIFKPGNLRCVKFDSMLSRSVNSDQGSQRRPKGIAVYVNFSIPPSLVITQIEKSLKITFSSISPYSQHFIFSLLPTFSPRFLPPPYCVPPPSIYEYVGRLQRRLSMTRQKRDLMLWLALRNGLCSLNDIKL